MNRVVIAQISKEDAEKTYKISTWEPYDTEGPVIEKWLLVPPELGQEAVYILEGNVTVRALGCDYHLKPGHMIALDEGVEFFWIVDDFVKSVYKMSQDI